MTKAFRSPHSVRVELAPSLSFGLCRRLCLSRCVCVPLSRCVCVCVSLSRCVCVCVSLSRCVYVSFSLFASATHDLFPSRCICLPFQLSLSRSHVSVSASVSTSVCMSLLLSRLCHHGPAYHAPGHWPSTAIIILTNGAPWFGVPSASSARGHGCVGDR